VVLVLVAACLALARARAGAPAVAHLSAADQAVAHPALANAAAAPGYTIVTQAGTAYTFGGSPSIPAGVGGVDPPSPVVDAVANPSGQGYWTVSADGTVTAVDGAPFLGDTYTYGITGLSGPHPLNAPIVGMAPTANGQGYWLVAADGGVFNFGDASFHGSVYTYGITGLSGPHPLNAPIVAIVPAPNGGGYLLIGADGGTFDFGTVGFYGSVYTYGITGLSGPHPLNAPIVGGELTPDGGGYYLVGADGGVFNFGDAHFSGSTYDLGYTGLGGTNPLPAPITSFMESPTGTGYDVLAADGEVITLGGGIDLGNAPVGSSRAVAIIPDVWPLRLLTTQATTTGSLSIQLSASGGPLGSYTFSASSLPAGLTLSSSGLLAGTVAATQAETLTFPVTVTDDGGVATTTQFTLTVTPVGITSQPPVFALDSPGSMQLVASPSGDYTYKLAAGSLLPAGLALSPSGVISGTPTGSSSPVTIDLYANGTLEGIYQTTVTIAPGPIALEPAESNNWGGVVDTTATAGEVTSVTGTFSIPTLDASQPASCTAADGCQLSEWVGVDGFNDSSLIQAGVDIVPQFSSTGQLVTESIQPWWEELPAPETPETLMTPSGVPVTPQPGDAIKVTLTAEPDGNWTTTVTDLTQGASFTVTASYDGPDQSADWILETPLLEYQSTSVLAPLPAFTGGTFDALGLVANDVDGSYALTLVSQSGGSVTPTGTGTTLGYQGFGFSYSSS